MTKKNTYRTVAILLLSGIAIIILVTSLMIRQPSILASLTAVSPTAIISPATPTPQNIDIFPVFTATSADNTLSLPTTGIRPTSTATPLISTENGQLGTKTEPSINLTPTISPGIFCSRNDQIIIFLAVYDADPKNTDRPVTFLGYVKIDFLEHKIELLTLPSNLIVSGTTIKQLNLPPSSLDDLFQFTMTNISNPALEPVTVGTSVIARAIYDEIGLHPDYYAAIYSNDLIELIDEMGGLSSQFEDMEQNSMVIKDSYTGFDTLQILNNTDVPIDILLNRQNQVALSVLNKIKQPSFTENVTRLVTIFSNTAFTNMDQDMLREVLCIIGYIKTENIIIHNPTSSDFITTENGVLLTDSKNFQF